MVLDVRCARPYLAHSLCSFCAKCSKFEIVKKAVEVELEEGRKRFLADFFGGSFIQLCMMKRTAP